VQPGWFAESVSGSNLTCIDVAFDNAGNFYCVSSQFTIIKVAANGMQSRFPGDYNYLKGIAVDGDGNIYIAESSQNHDRNWVIKVDSLGRVTTVYQGFVWDIAVDSSDHLYVAVPRQILRVDDEGNVSAIAGNNDGIPDGGWGARARNFMVMAALPMMRRFVSRLKLRLTLLIISILLMWATIVFLKLPQGKLARLRAMADLQQQLVLSR